MLAKKYNVILLHQIYFPLRLVNFERVKFSSTFSYQEMLLGFKKVEVLSTQSAECSPFYFANFLQSSSKLKNFFKRIHLKICS